MRLLLFRLGKDMTVTRASGGQSALGWASRQGMNCSVAGSSRGVLIT
jgi:hypothetical protein